MKFFIVDAFTESLFGGNPAGVVIVDENTDFPDEWLMQKVATELRYSETVFVKHETDNEYTLRYFTVTDEVDLCGHATIAAFSVICDMERTQLVAGKNGPYNARDDKGNELKLGKPHNARHGESDEPKSGNLGERDKAVTNGQDKIRPENDINMVWTAITKAGRLRIESHQGKIFMDMAPPVDIEIISDDGLMDEICACVGLARDDIPGPVEIISTGLPDIIVPVKSRAILNSMNPDFAKMSEISEQLGVIGVHAFAFPDKNTEIFDNTHPDEKTETYDIKCTNKLIKTNDRTHPREKTVIHCRNFAPVVGIDEEAATGTANGALSRYLYKNGLIKDNSEIEIIQGEAMGRPSAIHAIVSLSGDDSLAECATDKAKRVTDTAERIADAAEYATNAVECVADAVECVADAAEYTTDTSENAANAAECISNSLAKEQMAINSDSTVDSNKVVDRRRIQIGGSCALLANGVILI